MPKNSSHWYRWEILFVSTFVILYTIAAILVSLHRYWQFDAFWLDFGIFDETVWRLSRFQLPVIPNLAPPHGKIVWADHFNPSAILLVPFYWISNRQEIILIAQVLFVSLSALVAYTIACKKVRNSLVRMALIVSYLGFVGLQNALYTDVHNIVFALLPFMLTVWTIYSQKWSLYWPFLFVMLAWQENLAAVGIGLGTFLLLRKERYIQIGFITVGISILWALLAYNIIIPYFNHNPYTYQPDVPTVWYEWLTRFFSKDLKTPTILYTLLTFGLLPLFSWATYPLMIEHFLERFVLNSAATRWDLGFHYNALLSPIMFLASVESIQLLQRHPTIKRFLPAWAGLTMFTVFFP